MHRPETSTLGPCECRPTWQVHVPRAGCISLSTIGKYAVLCILSFPPYGPNLKRRPRASTLRHLECRPTRKASAPRVELAGKCIRRWVALGSVP
eukprot:3709997-Prymnesium_polylepis.1